MRIKLSSRYRLNAILTILRQTTLARLNQWIKIAMREKNPQASLNCRRVGCLLLSLPCGFIFIFVIFISVISPPIAVGNEPQALPTEFLKGISYESWLAGEFASAESDKTLEQIVVPSGANWIAIIVKCYQDTRTSTAITCGQDRNSALDSEVQHVINRAHELGLKVMLKPHVDLRNLTNSTDGRYRIGFGSDEQAWSAWFESYTAFITHYAELAEAQKAEAFVVGTELWGTVHRETEWRTIIGKVRERFKGLLTYAALTYFEPLQITWWDSLDYIGVDAYFTLTLTNQATIAQMKLGWMPTVAYLEWLSNHWNKPIILTEVGYMSVDGTNVLPGDWSRPGEIDHQEQADAYQALFESFQGRTWWKGVFWWSLDTNPDQGGPNDRGYSFHNKPAEMILKRFFLPELIND
jgi:hypothetical protein